MSALLERKIDVPLEVREGNLLNLVNHGLTAEKWIEKHGVAYDDGFKGLDPIEMVRFGASIVTAETVWDVYRRLATLASTGESWYDLVIGIQHRDTYKMLGKALRKFQTRIADRGIDIGTGSGETARVLSKFCARVIGTDVVPEMLNLARDKVKSRQVEFVYDDIIRTQFGPNTFDVAVINGIGPYFTPEESIRFYQAMHYIMKPGARVFFVDNTVNAERVYETSPRAAIARTITKMMIDLTFQREVMMMKKEVDPREYFDSATYQIGEYPNAQCVIMTRK